MLCNHSVAILESPRKPVISFDNIGSSFQRCCRHLGLPGIHWDKRYHFLSEWLLSPEPHGYQSLEFHIMTTRSGWFSSDNRIWSPFLISFACCKAVSTPPVYLPPSENEREWHLRSHKEGVPWPSAIYYQLFRPPLLLPTAWLRTKEDRTNVLKPLSSFIQIAYFFSDLLYEDSASKLIGTYHFIIIYHGRKLRYRQ